MTILENGIKRNIQSDSSRQKLTSQKSPPCRSVSQLEGGCNLRCDSGINVVKKHFHGSPKGVLENLEE